MASLVSWLGKVPVDNEVAAGKVRGLGAQLPGLVAAGWLEARKDGRAVLVRLTEAGRAERDRLPTTPTKPARPARAARAPSPAARLAALEAAVAALTARVAVLEAPPAPPTEAPPTPAQDPAALRQDIVAAIGELDARDRLGGLVPIPDLRRELRARGVAATDHDVDAALEALERAWQIDLSVAQAPTQVADRAAGIERAGRGLLYYVARR